MDYEKKYNEALNWMRELYPGLHGATKEDAEHYFPELRESEDERIRKGLVKLLTVASEAYLVESTGIKKESYLSWLEKQKEQKPSDFPAGFYVTLPDGKKYYTKEMRCKGMNIKVVEPKPAEWSEEDEKMRNLAIEWAETMSGQISFVDMDSTDFRKIIAWLKSLRPCPSWKPSEEQMDALDKAIPVCMGVVGRDEIAPLESLYEQLQKL